MTPRLRIYVCRDCPRVRYATRLPAQFVAHMAEAHALYIDEADIPTLERRWELRELNGMKVRSAEGGK